MSKAYLRDVGSLDGRILNIIAADLGNSQVRYTYFDLAKEGYRFFSLQHIITATTLTLEACNMGGPPLNQIINGVATGSDAAGLTLADSALNTVHGFTTDDDLIGIYVQITADATTPGNVGQIREIIDYTAVTGTLTPATAFSGPTTNGVTKFRLYDNPNPWNRKVSDPPSTQWTDVTTVLTGAASHTASGIWLVDTDISIERLRVKRATTNATNALALRLTRTR